MAGTEPPDKGKETGGGDYQANDGDNRTFNQQSKTNQNETNPLQLSYADRLKTNVRFDQRLKRNVLEITLEKTGKDSEMDVGQADIVRIFNTLGIDIATQVQGYQVQFKGKVSLISVWMGPGINLERFCKDVNIRVKEGVMTGMIRPAGKTDVKVTIVGLDFNTPDTFVFDYLSKFGVVTSQTVAYSKFEIGPFKGKFNGERKFQVDFKNASRQMGTFHLIDGCKVKVFYRGNKKTCGRCHKFADGCPGKSIAKDCESNGGARVLLSQHMETLWSAIGFVPANFELEDKENIGDLVNEAENNAPLLAATSFPPISRPEPTSRDTEKFNGITIRNIPSTLNDKDILQFLINYGVPFGHDPGLIEITKKPRNTSVFVDGLTPEQVQTIFQSLHFPETNQKFFDVPIYCKPLRNMTPMKTTIDNKDTTKGDSDDIKASANPKEPGATETDSNPAPPQVKDPTIGLSRSQQKKEAKKVKEKKKQEEKKREEEIKKNEVNKKDQVQKNLDQIKKDFMKNKDLDSSACLEDHFEFDDSLATLTPSVSKESGSKFFSTTPLEMSPTPLKSFAARQIVVESIVQNQGKNDREKRMMTPENEERSTRFKEGKGALD